MFSTSTSEVLLIVLDYELLTLSVSVLRITGLDQRRLTNLETVIEEVGFEADAVCLMHGLICL